MHKLTPFLLFLLSGLFVSLFPSLTPAAFSQDSQVDVYDLPVLSPKEQSADSYEHELLHQQIAVNANGDINYILTRRLTNLAINDWTQTSWSLNFAPGVYSDIRAEDSNGVLPTATTQDGTRITITIHFRDAIEIGETYEFSLALTLERVAEPNGDYGNLNWRITPSTPIQHYIREVTIPLNATLQSVQPTPTEQHNNYLEWRASNTPASWQHTVYINYRLSNYISAPLFLQDGTDRPGEDWGSDLYGDPSIDPLGYTMADWGCYTTSAAMIIDYYAEQAETSHRTNPRLVNDWYRDEGLYQGASFVHDHIATYGRDEDHNVPVYLPEPKEWTTKSDEADQRIINSLRSGNPVLLHLPVQDGVPFGHFVVATGVEYTDNNEVTYVINDPELGVVTLSDHYTNTYDQIGWFTGTPADLRALSISGHSPIELVVTDPIGRKIGYNPVTGERWDEIPNASYGVTRFGPLGATNPDAGVDYHELMILAPLNGDYIIEVIGTGSGDYTLYTSASNFRGKSSSIRYTGTIQQDTVNVIDATYDDVDGLFTYEIRLPVIQNRDG